MVRTKEKKESSLTSVLIGALATVFLGLLLGFIVEVGRTPEFVRNQPDLVEASNPLALKFRLGDRQTTDGWRQMIDNAQTGTFRGSSIQLDESELNGIATQYLNFSMGKQQALQADEAPTYALLPETPNFSMMADELQVTIPFDAFIFGRQSSGFLVAKGHFEEKGNDSSFVVDDAWINSARIPAFLARPILSRLIRSVQEISSDSPLIAALNQVRPVGVKESELIVAPR